MRGDGMATNIRPSGLTGQNSTEREREREREYVRERETARSASRNRKFTYPVASGRLAACQLDD